MSRRGNYKRGAGRYVQLSEALQATEAWATLKPGPRALYVALKRLYRGYNNGRLFLSHRDAAVALNVHRNTIGPWFQELERRGLIWMVHPAHLGCEGFGKSALWALSELPTVDGKRATHAYRRWAEKQNPGPKTVRRRHNDCDTAPKAKPSSTPPVTLAVTR